MQDAPRGTSARHQGEVAMEREGAKGDHRSSPCQNRSQRKLLSMLFAQNGT